MPVAENPSERSHDHGKRHEPSRTGRSGTARSATRSGEEAHSQPMSGRPFLWTRQKAGGLSGWRLCSGSTRLMDAHPILNGSLKDIDVYDCEVFELDAIARNTGLADRGAIGARQVGLVVEAKHIDRNASRVGAQANAIKLSRRPIGVGDGAGAVANVRVGHNLAQGRLPGCGRGRGCLLPFRRVLSTVGQRTVCRLSSVAWWGGVPGQVTVWSGGLRSASHGGLTNRT